MRFLLDHARFRRGAIQFGSLPYRMNGSSLQIMLVTSRASGSWILPKGWLAPGLPPHRSAAKEAYEEAGILGQPGSEPIGAFMHRKSTGRRVQVEIYPLRVTEELENWPERLQRKRRWFNPHQAALVVSNMALRQLISSFRPPDL
jgi:8-oxo-dGTP pyrophosphatase MutT (NUDIX family)